MKDLTTIGLEKKSSKELAEDLNKLLASFQVYYQNLRGVHWNIKGENFFALHEKFEELYLDSQQKIDDIAERILTLGATPLHTYSDYLEESSVKAGKNISDSEGSVGLVLDSIEELLKLERDILDKSDELGDEGTNSMMSDFITEQEKTAWMLNAFLGKKV